MNTSAEPQQKPKKKLNGFYIIAAVLIVMIITTYRPNIPGIHCNEEVLASNPDVVMFGTWWCPYCRQTREYLHDNNISYCEYDIEKSDVGKQLYDETKATAIPALIIGKFLLQGFNGSSIDQALILTKENNELSH